MAEKELGYVELEWTCPSCNTRNPGSAPKCRQCGTPMPADVKFEQAAEEQLLTDQAKIAAAKAGPDVYCGYCGTRNVSTAKICKQCGASLAEGSARETQGVIGALRDKPAPPQKCPNCGTENKPNALKCGNCGAPLGKAVPAAVAAPAPSARPGGIGILPLILLGVVVLIGAFVLFGRRSSETVAQVADYGWRRTIAVQQLAPVTRDGWLDQLPAGVEVVGCRKEVYQTVSNPVPGAREICGTPYVVDTGAGFGQVKQECEYQVLADYCQYRTLEWVLGPPLILEGRDLAPRWPVANLGPNQRPGGRSEEYFVVFRADDRDYDYTTRDPEEYLALAQGGRWKLTINGFGQIVSIDPA